MEYTLEKLSSNKAKINFTFPADVFSAEMDKAYKKMRGKLNVPGFRKGKAPRKLIESMYGQEVFFEEVIDSLFPPAYQTAVTENKLHPVGYPELQVDKMVPGNDLSFACEVFVYPDVTLGEYMGVEVKVAKKTISDAEVDQRLEQEQKRIARHIDVIDRALQSGDKANFDYSGSVDGVKFEGGTAEKQELVIGSGNFIPGFEEQMIGMQIGEEKDLTVTFPTEYHAEELKGKDAIFHVKLHSISCEEIPALDDEFASEVSEFDTLEEYRNSIKADMQKKADDSSLDMAKNQLISTIADNADIMIPAPMVEERLDNMLHRMEHSMHQQGFTMDRYLQIIGKDKNSLRDMYKQEAINQLKQEIVLDEIATKENIEVNDEDLEKAIADYAAQYHQTVESVKEIMNDQAIEYFKNTQRISKTTEMLWEKAVKVEEAEEATTSETPAE